MGKEEFVSRCLQHGIKEETADKAWHKLQDLEKHILNNWESFEKLQKYSKDKKLRLREYAAERGFEYTPDELDKLIKVIGTVQRNMEK